MANSIVGPVWLDECQTTSECYEQGLALECGTYSELERVNLTLLTLVVLCFVMHDS